MEHRLKPQNAKFHTITGPYQDLTLKPIEIKLDEKELDTAQIKENKVVTVLEKKTVSDSVELF